MKKEKRLFGVIGLGRFGLSLASYLSKDNQEVLVIDCNENKIRQALSFTQNAYAVSEITKEALIECSIQNCDVVFVCIGEKIDISILTTLIVLELGVKKVISKATSTEQGTVLEKLGAQVVYPECDMAYQLSKKFTSTNILDLISLSSEYNITELKLNKKFNNKSVEEISFRNKYGLNIIAIERFSGEVIIDIVPSTILLADDTIVVCGENKSILNFEKTIN